MKIAKRKIYENIKKSKIDSDLNTLFTPYACNECI